MFLVQVAEIFRDQDADQAPDHGEEPDPSCELTAACCLCVRAELSACETRCVALRRVTQTLQTEMLHLYSQMHLDTHTQDICSR